MTLYLAALLADRVGNGGADGKPIDALRATRTADSSAASIMETTRAASKYMRAPHLDSEHPAISRGLAARARGYVPSRCSPRLRRGPGD